MKFPVGLLKAFHIGLVLLAFGFEIDLKLPGAIHGGATFFEDLLLTLEVGLKQTLEIRDTPLRVCLLLFNRQADGGEESLVSLQLMLDLLRLFDKDLLDLLDMLAMLTLLFLGLSPQGVRTGALVFEFLAGGLEVLCGGPSLLFERGDVGRKAPQAGLMPGLRVGGFLPGVGKLAPRRGDFTGRGFGPLLQFRHSVRQFLCPLLSLSWWTWSSLCASLSASC